ncbi:hypothetical protein CBL_04585 [Carabus blaptoides fortunei]
MSSSRKSETTEDDDIIVTNTNSETSSISSPAAESNRELSNRRGTSNYSNRYSRPTIPLNDLGFSNSDIDLAHEFATSHISRFFDENRQYQEVVQRYRQPSNLPRPSEPIRVRNELRNVPHERAPRTRESAVEVENPSDVCFALFGYPAGTLWLNSAGSETLKDT